MTKLMCVPRVILLSLVALAVGRLPTLAQPTSFSYDIDPDLEPALPALPGIGDGPERPLVAVLEPDGTHGDYVANEIILLGPTQGQLDVFVETYAGQIVSGGSLPTDPGNLPPDKLRPEHADSDDYLVRVDTGQFPFNEEIFLDRMTSLGYEGHYLFSSDQAVHLLALVIQEQLTNDLQITLNPLMMPPPQPAEPAVASLSLPAAVSGPASSEVVNCVMCKTEEFAVSGGYANSFTFGWLNDAGLRATRAWQYYDLLNMTSGSPPVLAMVDMGFALNADFPTNVPQYDFVTEQTTTSGNPNTLPSGGTWHGTGTLGLAAARLNNQFGTAGTGGQVAFPYLFRPEGTLYGVAEAVRTAVYWGADVINISAAADGASIFQWLALIKASDKAYSANTIVLATAGNNGSDASDYYPCATPGFLCVGGIDMATKTADPGSNYGSEIDVWAPYNGLFTTPNPSSGGALPGFGGTCGASAYTAGVVTLMRAVHPSLTSDTARTLLQGSANPSTDAKLAGAGGYLNAYGAVKAAAQAAGRTPQGDAYEPNETAAAAKALPSGTSTATIAPGDVDVYSITNTDLVDLDLQLTFEDVKAPNNGLYARFDNDWGTPANGTIALDQTLLPPGTHTLNVWGQSGDTINCYHTIMSMSASTIAPDIYDDQTPVGEPRNDYFTDRALIPGTVEANVLLPMKTIADLNFDVKSDVDVFEVVLAPETDPTTKQSECLSPGDPGYGSEGFMQGSVEISAWPNSWTPSTPGWSWPFDLAIYDATGSVVTATTGLRLSLDCPHQVFPDGKLRFSVKGKDGQRNYYRVFIHYRRWDAYWDVPLWVWEQTEPPLLRVIPPWGRLIEFRFPRDPAAIAQWAAGDPPVPGPSDVNVFRWPALGDLDLFLSTIGPGSLQVTVYDAGGTAIGQTDLGTTRATALQAEAGDEGQIHIPDLEPGVYGFTVQGDIGTVYTVRVGTPHTIYLPLISRNTDP